MCGICGLYRAWDDQPVDRGLLARMNASLVHRGPDSAGYYYCGSLGMAMRRLAIIDLATGEQPIYNEDGSIAVTFNGEIYNYRQLGAELEEAGHHFQTRSDTEVIVHAYEQWGDDALPLFNGMFAFALWDGRRRRLLLARDRMGKKPLYWHFSARGLVWGSEVKALLVAPWIEQRLNPLALHHYLTLQYALPPLTFYEGIAQLPAAHKLVIEPGKEPQVARWWQLAFEPKIDIDATEACEQAPLLLAAAVERRLIAEVPLGAFLSGGIDSTIVVALMAERLAEPVKTFSIGFDERRYSETPYARLVAKRYQTDHHEFVFRPADLLRVVAGTLAACDEPLADPAILPLYELARQARQYVTVALCGDGGDETLAGYSRYWVDRWLGGYARLPAWVTQQAVPGLLKGLPDRLNLPEDRNPLGVAKKLSQFAAVTPKASLVRWGSYFSHAEKMNLYQEDLRQQLGNENTADWLAAAYDQALAESQLDRTLAAEHVTYLAGDLLPKTDRATMAHSLEARSPFLDAEWVAWTARLPVNYKVRRTQTKWLLKAAFGDWLPPEIRRRGKQGFSVPVGLWLRHELKPWVDDYLVHNPRLGSVFNPAAVQEMVAQHETGRVNRGKQLWALLMFALWQEKLP